MKLVKFETGKYGVKIGFWLFGYKFLGDDGFAWSQKDYIRKYCQFETLEQAKAIANEYKLKHVVLKKEE
jgi:hypothetical protein